VQPADHILALQDQRHAERQEKHPPPPDYGDARLSRTAQQQRGGDPPSRRVSPQEYQEKGLVEKCWHASPPSDATGRDKLAGLHSTPQPRGTITQGCPQGRGTGWSPQGPRGVLPPRPPAVAGVELAARRPWQHPPRPLRGQASSSAVRPPSSAPGWPQAGLSGLSREDSPPGGFGVTMEHGTTAPSRGGETDDRRKGVPHRRPQRPCIRSRWRADGLHPGVGRPGLLPWRLPQRP